jgi:hypothetical protein
MSNIVMLHVIMLNDIILKVAMLKVMILNSVMPSGINLSVNMLSVMAPTYLSHGHRNICAEDYLKADIHTSSKLFCPLISIRLPNPPNGTSSSGNKLQHLFTCVAFFVKRETCQLLTGLCAAI